MYMVICKRWEQGAGESNKKEKVFFFIKVEKLYRPEIYVEFDAQSIRQNNFVNIFPL